MFDDDTGRKKYFFQILNTSKYSSHQTEKTTTIKKSVLVVVWVISIKIYNIYIYVCMTSLVSRYVQHLSPNVFDDEIHKETTIKKSFYYCLLSIILSFKI